MTTPPQPTSGETREDQATETGAAIGLLYAALETAILLAVAAAVTAVIRGTLAVIARRRMRQTIAAAITITESRAARILTAAARDTQAATAGTGRGLERLGERLTGRAVTQLRPGLPAVTADLHAAGLNAFREADDVYRQAVEAAMGRRTITTIPDLSLLPGRGGTLSRLQAAQQVLDAFARKGVTGFTDRAGRDWDLASYAEMATRTADSRLRLALQVRQMGDQGTDLAVVDYWGHLVGCEKCRPWEGRVISLSGAVARGVRVSAEDAGGRMHTVEVAGTLAQARGSGLFHPQHELPPFLDPV